MAAIGDWLRALLVVVLLGNLVDFLLPKGDMKRYGGLIVGLVILATIVTPLWGWMRDLHKLSALSGTEGFTNTSAGYHSVVANEEMHQAEAIVLSMPHVVQCHLSLAVNGTVEGVVRADSRSVTSQEVTHYVRAALQVTMGQAPTVHITVERPSQGSHQVTQ